MNFLSPVPQSAVVTITPAMAKELLATSPGNRSIRPSHTRLLSIAMKRGDWLVTSQGIGIDNKGRLRDAHHRLQACVLADTPFESTIVWGLPEDAYQVTDRGISRSYHDILDCAKPVAEVLRLAGQVITGSGRPTRREIDPLMDSGFKDLIEGLIRYCPTKVAYFSSASFKLCAATQIANNVDTEFIYSQYRALVSADYGNMTPASQALTRQVSTKSGVYSTNKTDLFSRALVVLDPSRAHTRRIIVDTESRIAASEYIRQSLIKFIATNGAV
jgi:hypothetical protein